MTPTNQQEIIIALETKSAKEVGRIIGMRTDTLSVLLRSCGTSIPEIRRKFRTKYIADHPHKTVKQLAEDWNCSLFTVYRFKEQMRVGK